MSKKYGLFVPEKNKVINRPSIFNTESDSDSEPEKPTGISAPKRQELRAQEKLVAEDPTIYQYDELYDDMQSQRKESKLARKDLSKKPKYINKLLESAERRKKENERRIERQIQKERDAEGNTYKDKEAFVTTAYRKKLEELKELEEKEKREEYLEAIGDVRKQSDLSGFYRHLYEQSVDDKDMQEDEKAETKQEVKKEDEVEDRKESETVTSKNGTDVEPENVSKMKSSKASENRKRKYRKRESSSSENETEVKLEHLPSNIDADSDFSIDSDSDSESENKKSKVEGTDKNKTKEIKEENQDPNTGTTNLPEEIKQESDVKKEENEDEPKVEAKPKLKVNIWKKRTVDEVFDAALKRYYERKATRMNA